MLLEGGDVSRRADKYVDDADTWAGSILTEHKTPHTVIADLQYNSQTWSDISDAVFQAVAHVKYVVSLLSHKEVKGRQDIDYGGTYDTELEVYQGAKTNIQYAKPNEPNIGLGYRQAPDGNQDHEFKHRLKRTR